MPTLRSAFKDRKDPMEPWNEPFINQGAAKYRTSKKQSAYNVPTSSKARKGAVNRYEDTLEEPAYRRPIKGHFMPSFRGQKSGAYNTFETAYGAPRNAANNFDIGNQARGKAQQDAADQSPDLAGYRDQIDANVSIIVPLIAKQGARQGNKLSSQTYTIITSERPDKFEHDGGHSYPNYQAIVVCGPSNKELVTSDWAYSQKEALDRLLRTTSGIIWSLYERSKLPTSQGPNTIVIQDYGRYVALYECTMPSMKERDPSRLSKFVERQHVEKHEIFD